jgi:hypothetical protein
MTEESPESDVMCAKRSSTSITLTANFIMISVLLVVAIAFSIGATARIVLLSFVYAVFIDLKKVFDTMIRERCLLILEGHGHASTYLPF